MGGLVVMGVIEFQFFLLEERKKDRSSAIEAQEKDHRGRFLITCG